MREIRGALRDFLLSSWEVQVSSVSPASRRHVISSGWFCAWALIGFALALSILSMGIGLLLFVPAFAGAALLSRHPSARSFARGAITGAGGTLLALAWIQRSGDYGQPLLFLALGLALVLAGIVAQARN